ncbi:hypothetical protein DEIPH_ctg011orf0198 [Deinococcus phoenicis]|uniref:Uncharacterized protein n=1 Tax=Deinococcus phoenicis TaxID=1476583 RepID=A0A016QSV7_9DEIO|nr:hypothetical protein DEIPH_ctg011orf0198 [Deinococcus phoenicis]
MSSSPASSVGATDGADRWRACGLSGWWLGGWRLGEEASAAPNKAAASSRAARRRTEGVGVGVQRTGAWVIGVLPGRAWPWNGT